MEYMIVHRAGEIYKLRFRYDEISKRCYLESNPGIFYPIFGWEAGKVIDWLQERSFEYYWETDHD